MKATVLGIAVVLIAVLPATSDAQQWTGNLNAFLGAKALDENDWEPVEDQAEFGVLIDFKRTTWPVSIAIDLLRSEEDGTEFGVAVHGETTEVNLGVRKIWDQNASVRPYVGGGVALISADVSAVFLGINVSDDDDAEGAWVDAGIYWTLGASFNIGLDLRYSQADVTLFGTDADAGGSHAGLLLGYHW